MSNWLVLDVNYLCWRNFYSGMRNLSYNEIPTGVVFGLLRDIANFQQTHSTKKLVFCFDHGKSIRKQMDPGYKASRQAKRDALTADEQNAIQALMDQVELLKTKVIPKLGYRNVFYQEGYEADDMIASFCRSNPNLPIIIVSADADLYQLLSPNVSMWNPTEQRFTHVEDYIAAWGLKPRQWPQVKALAGCSSDDIRGVVGVGEKTAAKFLRGEMKPTGKIYDAIAGAKPVVKKNLKLVTLPLEGAVPLSPVPDETNNKVWNKMVKKYGMTSLVRKEPKFRSK